ncbi:putative lipid II flippase FtsW [Kaustia mangrovi]|uniref:Probable peptidoglycan glycosyltransferase FtsW n=1 Tax=Kaustia mangrovi TaxID=2593653 RepID=A0A7S8C7K8_9HYPH|nr:putative lipid II flippase FtsW [Kaustia mangrovi]QPC44885.1 putative lipid II flippase FtsW [Kaustia mangrovi]
MSLISRKDRGLIANWWFTIDRLLLTALLILVALGAMLSMAASPPVAERLGVDPFFFFRRHVVYMVLAAIVLVATSFLNPRQARRICLVALIAGIGLMMLALAVGPEVKGARRWLDIGPLSIQPSEFVKPAFIVLTAWLFAENRLRPDMPGVLIAGGMLATVLGLLILQPDYGQTILVGAVWAELLFLTGISWTLIAGLGGAAIGGLFFAYTSVSHFASRIDRFLNPEAGDTYQVDTAIQAFEHGGLFGVGPGSGTVKSILPDAHSDFVFAVAGEEFGLIACLILLGLFAFVVVRGLRHGLRAHDPFIALAVVGLVSIFGFQAAINMAVNVSLLPAKGMTLPFISYGGSSLISMAFAMGLVVGLTRRRPAGFAPPRAGLVGATA